MLILLTGCSSQLPLKPYALIESENRMQKGLQAYQQDRYLQAQQFFKQALLLYQSIDDQTGQHNAYYNLIESHLAIHQLKTVATLIQRLTTQKTDELILIKARFLFAQAHYKQALKILQPLSHSLLSQGSKKLSSKQLILLFYQSKFSLFSKDRDTLTWYHFLDTQKDTFTPNQQALFNRLNAHKAAQAGQYLTAINLMKTALTRYKKSAHRRGIANCLQELGEFYRLNNDKIKAKSVWLRALKIRQWLNDRYKVNELSIRIKEISK